MAATPLRSTPPRPDRPAGTGSASSGSAQLRLMSQVARLYHVRKLRQREIAARLHVSQARVSRLLAQAEEQGIVRTAVVVPDGLHPELESAIEVGYGIPEVHVVEVSDDQSLPEELGQTAAQYFSDHPPDGSRIGFTSWSTTLRVMAAEMTPVRGSGRRSVVEMLGDLGSPEHQHEAARATQRLARALGAEPVFLRTPGVVSDATRQRLVADDPYVGRTLDLLGRLDDAFVGVGPAEYHGPLREGDNFFSAAQLSSVRQLGAVGQLLQRFVDADGRPVRTPLDDLVVGITLAQLRAAGRRIVVAGGRSKHAALTACLRGGWVDLLITDLATARHLRFACSLGAVNSDSVAN